MYGDFDFEDFDFSDFFDQIGLHNKSIYNSTSGGPGGPNNPNLQPYPFNFDESDEFNRQSDTNLSYEQFDLYDTRKLALRDYDKNIIYNESEPYTPHTIDYIQKCIASNNERLLPHKGLHMQEKDFIVDASNVRIMACKLMFAGNIPETQTINDIKKSIYLDKLEHNILIEAKKYYFDTKNGSEASKQSKFAFDF